MMQDAEEITRIIRLSSLLADTVLLSSSPATTATVTSTASATIGNRSYNNENDDKQPEQQHQLSILCSKLLRNCEKLEYLCIQDCNITTFSNDLLTCLPSDHFKELVLDIDINNDSDKNDSVNDSTEKEKKRKNHHLWSLLNAYPLLHHIDGTYIKYNIADKKSLQSLLQLRNTTTTTTTSVSSSSLIHHTPWDFFWNNNNKNKSSPSNRVNTISQERKENQQPLEKNFIVQSSKLSSNLTHDDCRNKLKKHCNNNNNNNGIISNKPFPPSNAFLPLPADDVDATATAIMSNGTGSSSCSNGVYYYDLY